MTTLGQHQKVVSDSKHAPSGLSLSKLRLKVVLCQQHIARRGATLCLRRAPRLIRLQLAAFLLVTVPPSGAQLVRLVADGWQYEFAVDVSRPGRQCLQTSGRSLKRAPVPDASSLRVADGKKPVASVTVSAGTVGRNVGEERPFFTRACARSLRDMCFDLPHVLRQASRLGAGGHSWRYRLA